MYSIITSSPGVHACRRKRKQVDQTTDTIMNPKPLTKVPKVVCVCVCVCVAQRMRIQKKDFIFTEVTQIYCRRYQVRAFMVLRRLYTISYEQQTMYMYKPVGSKTHSPSHLYINPAILYFHIQPPITTPNIHALHINFIDDIDDIDDQQTHFR